MSGTEAGSKNQSGRGTPQGRNPAIAIIAIFVLGVGLMSWLGDGEESEGGMPVADIDSETEAGPIDEAAVEMALEELGEVDWGQVIRDAWAEAEDGEWHVFDNFSSEELQSLDLAGISFAFSNLSDTDLSGMDLRGTRFFASNLADADLSGANLAGAVFAGVNLKDADLSDACLSGARMLGVDVEDARFDGATLIDTEWVEVDRSDASFSGTVTEGDTPCP